MNYFFFAGPYSEESDLLFVRETDSRDLYNYLLSKMSNGKNNFVSGFSKKILDALFVASINVSNTYIDLYKQEYSSLGDYLKHEFLLKDAPSKKINELLQNGVFSLFKINLYEVVGYSLGQLISGDFDGDYAIIKEIDKKMKEYYESRK